MKIIESYEEVDEVINKELVMIIAKTNTCSACQTITKILENNLKHYHEIEKYSIYVDKVDKFRGEHLIFSVPTVLIFNKGKEILRESKYLNYAKIDRLIEIFYS